MKGQTGGGRSPHRGGRARRPRMRTAREKKCGLGKRQLLLCLAESHRHSAEKTCAAWPPDSLFVNLPPSPTTTCGRHSAALSRPIVGACCCPPRRPKQTLASPMARPARLLGAMLPLSLASYAPRARAADPLALACLACSFHRRRLARPDAALLSTASLMQRREIA